MRTINDTEYLTDDETCTELRITRGTLASMTRDDEIDFIASRGRMLFKAIEVERVRRLQDKAERGWLRAEFARLRDGKGE